MSLKAIDVAIGMAFLYLLATLIASALVELIATYKNWRGAMLLRAICEILSGSPVSADELYKTPFIRVLAKQLPTSSGNELAVGQTLVMRKLPDLPSYIPATAFGNAVLSVLWLRCLEKDPNLHSRRPEEIAWSVGSMAAEDFPAADKEENGNRPTEVKGLGVVVQTALITQGPSIQGIRLALEKWFTDSMDRLSGTYKRRTYIYLLAIGIVAAFSGNIDSIGVAKWLWNGDSARQAVVAAATDYARSAPTPTGVPKEKGQSPTEIAAENVAKEVAMASAKLTDLQFPVGWSSVEFSAKWFLQYLMGCFISGIAISVGSSFWFDALQALIKIRATGPRPAAR